MTELLVTSTPTGWCLPVDGYEVVADYPRPDRGVVRATFTVKKDGLILFRDTANLTSGRARAGLLRGLAEKNVSLDERVLIALDEACRRPKPRRGEGRDAPSDISETVPLDLAGLRKVFGRWLLIHDPAFLPVFLGSILAHRLDGEPVWLLLVAPPGGTKTEPIRALYGYPGIFPLSELTARTFASGLDAAGGDPSLLARLMDEILVLKDFTTILEMHRDERQAILAQLREIYDGRFDKVWGTGREVHWEGRLGFVAGVTPIIDRHQAALSVLGERFILFRPAMPDRRALARAALRGAGREDEMRRDLVQAMHRFLASRSHEAPIVGRRARDTLATVADFVTRARSGVVRDGSRRELEYAPEPEAPTRFAKVLLGLARGIALAYDSQRVTRRELRLTLRTALDCLPVIRRRVIAALLSGAVTEDSNGTLSTTAVAGMSQFSTQSIRRCLEDLQALGVVTGHKTGTGRADTWELLPSFTETFATLLDAAELRVIAHPPPQEDDDASVPEMSEGASHADDLFRSEAEEELVWKA